MKKALIVAGISGAVFLSAVAIRVSGPRYQGRSAAAWVEVLHATSAVARYEAANAVRALGTNAIPLLVEKLQARDSALRSNVTAVLRKQDLMPIPPSSATQARQDAVRGFEALGSESAAAVTALVRLLEDPRTADHASYALMQMNDGVIPALLIAVTNSGLQVRRRVVADLGNRHTNAPGVELALVERMRIDPDPSTRSMAVNSLGRVPHLSRMAIDALIEALADPVLAVSAANALGAAGPHARPAIPALEQLVRGQPGVGAMAGLSARQALSTIDPTVLTRLGIVHVPRTNPYE